MAHGDGERSRADEGRGVDGPAVLEHGAVERQVVGAAITPETAEERHGPAIHRPDTDSRCGIEPRAQGFSGLSYPLRLPAGS